MLRIGMFLADRYEIVEMLGAGGMAEVTVPNVIN